MHIGNTTIAKIGFATGLVAWNAYAAEKLPAGGVVCDIEIWLISLYFPLPKTCSIRRLREHSVKMGGLWWVSSSNQFRLDTARAEYDIKL